MAGQAPIFYLDQSGERTLVEKFGSKSRDVLTFECILKYAREFLGCQSVLVEEKYIDRDYRDEFSHLYSKMFKRFDSYCQRLHFFKARISDENEVITKDNNHLGYSGYVVIRPIDVGKVGRTVLAAYRNNPTKDYPLCASDFESHLLGRKFNVCGTPFIQQDTMVMCCAHAAIWMAARYMHQEFGFPECLPYEISENASRYFTLSPRVLPTEGLFSSEIANALTNMGYSPTMHSKPKRAFFDTTKEYQRNLKRWDPARFIYRYIESKIPVIALFPGHAATIIGHTFEHTRWQRLSNKTEAANGWNICYSHHCADSFIMHDGLVGPYRILPVSKEDQDNQIAQGRKSLLPSRGKDFPYRTLDDIEEFIVPLPEKVYVLAEHIDDIIKGLLWEGPYHNILYDHVAEMAQQGNHTAIDFLLSLQNPDNPVLLRVFLMRSVDYKRHVATDAVAHRMHHQVVEEYRRLHMARFIWVIQLTNMDNYCKETPGEREIFGEILIDATGNKLGLCHLAIHLPGVLFIRQVEDDYLPDPLPIPDDHSYCIQMR